MIDLLEVKVILQIPFNWFQFLIHITLRVVAQVLEIQSTTYEDRDWLILNIDMMCLLQQWLKLMHMRLYLHNFIITTYKPNAIVKLMMLVFLHKLLF